MATGGKTMGSEAVFDHVCSPCSDEQTKEAVGFCVDCGEWLCEECFRVHTVPKPSRKHVLKSAEEMGDSVQGLTAADRCTEKCDRHGGKRVKYFCVDHDVTICSECVIDDHRTCNVRKLSDIATDAATKTKFQQTTSELDEIAKQSNELVIDVREKIGLVKQNKAETVEAFRKYKKELVESLEELEVDLEDRCNKKEKEETERLEKIADRCGELEKASLQTRSQFEVYEDRGQHCNMFVAIKRDKNKVKGMRDRLREAQGSSGVTLYTFTPNLETGEILKRAEGLGMLEKKGSRRSDTDYTKIEAKHLADISVRSEGKETCEITGSVLLPGHKLVLTDLKNSEVKVVDTNQNKMMSKIEIDGGMWARLQDKLQSNVGSSSTDSSRTLDDSSFTLGPGRISSYRN